jgi:hypothetical protein
VSTEVKSLRTADIDYIGSNEMMVGDELESLWEEVVMARFKELSRHLSGETEESHGDPQSG